MSERAEPTITVHSHKYVRDLVGGPARDGAGQRPGNMSRGAAATPPRLPTPSPDMPHRRQPSTGGGFYTAQRAAVPRLKSASQLRAAPGPQPAGEQHAAQESLRRVAEQEREQRFQNLLVRIEDGLQCGQGSQAQSQPGAGGKQGAEEEERRKRQHRRWLQQHKQGHAVVSSERGSAEAQADADQQSVLQHWLTDRALSPALWLSLDTTHARYRAGRDGCYRPKQPASPTVKAATQEQQASHIVFDDQGFPKGNGAVLEEWPVRRRRAQCPDEKQGRTTLFQTLHWTSDAYAGGRSATYGDAWLEAYYTKGRRRPPSAERRRLGVADSLRLCEPAQSASAQRQQGGQQSTTAQQHTTAQHSPPNVAVSEQQGAVEQRSSECYNTAAKGSSQQAGGLSRGAPEPSATAFSCRSKKAVPGAPRGNDMKTLLYSWE